MNILVINPANRPFTNRSIIAEPIDVLNIATIIEKEYKNTRVIDMDLNDMNNDISNYLKEDNILVFVFDYQLPLHTSDAKINIFETIKKAKEKSNNIKSIIIGKTPSFYYEEFLNNGIDLIIKGIADNKINEVIKYINDINRLKEISNLIFKDQDNIIKTKEERITNSFSNLPIPKRELLYLNDYMDTRTMITSRGCIGTCKFCSTPYFFGSWNGKDKDQVVDEIELLIKNYQTKKIMFLDDNFLVDKKRVLAICDEIEKRNIKCLYGCLCSIKCFDKEIIKRMYQVGFRWIHFGIETGSSRLLKQMNKEMDINRIKEIIKETKEIGYRIRNSFILDYPTTTKEDLIKTKELILELEPHEIRLHYLAYRVGTPIYEENKNIINKTQYIHSNKPNIENKDLESEIDNLLKELEKRNYNIITNDIDWNIYNNQNKDTKIVAFTPIKYGMCWYE